MACSASFDRGLERKEIPKSLTKVADASPRVSAKAMLAKPMESWSTTFGHLV